MKKLLSVSLCLIIIACLCVPAFAAGQPESIQPRNITSWYINANNINFYASTADIGKGNVWGVVKFGDISWDRGLTNFTINGHYYRLCEMTFGGNSGKTGYVAKQYTSFGSI